MTVSQKVPVGVQSVPIASATPVTNVFTRDFTATFGAITALTGTAVTQTVAGLLTTDQVFVQCLGTMTAGATIANARVSAANTLEITFTTAVALGVSLGSLSWRVTVFR